MGVAPLPTQRRDPPFEHSEEPGIAQAPRSGVTARDQWRSGRRSSPAALLCARRGDTRHPVFSVVPSTSPQGGSDVLPKCECPAVPTGSV